MWEGPLFPSVPKFKTFPFSVMSRILSRLLMWLFEYPAIGEMIAVKRMLKNENNYDLLISFAVPYPVHWGTAWARSEKWPIAKTWIADCGDPYMGDVLDSFRKPFYFGYLEKWFCRKAEYISIPIESAKPGYYVEFRNKIKIIPQGFNFELDRPKENQCRKTIPEFAYSGSFLKGIRDPGRLLQSLIKTDQPFKFYVFTNQPDVLEDFQSILNEKLIVMPYIERPELMKKLSSMDFLINFDNNTSLNVPSKLIDYAITNRPVLNVDKNFTFETILAFLKGDYSKRMLMPDPRQYHIKNVSKLFLDLI